MKKSVIGKIGDLPLYLKNGVKLVKFYGTVKEIRDIEEDRLTIIIIEDDTGVIEARIFGSKYDREYLLNGIEIGSKVLVIGELRAWEGEVYILLRGIRKINEDEALYYELRYKRFKKWVLNQEDSS